MLINGEDLRELDLPWLRCQMGLVGQEPVLFNKTIAENICCDRPVNIVEMEQAARDANAHDFITRLPLVGEHSLELYKIVLMDFGLF